MKLIGRRCDLKNVVIKGITLDKMHLKLADIGEYGTNLPLDEAAEGNDVKVDHRLPPDMARRTPYSCDGKFVPMR